MKKGSFYAALYRKDLLLKDEIQKSTNSKKMVTNKSENLNKKINNQKTRNKS